MAKNTKGKKGGLRDPLYGVPPVCSLRSKSPEQLVQSYRKKPLFYARLFGICNLYKLKVVTTFLTIMKLSF